MKYNSPEENILYLACEFVFACVCVYMCVMCG